MWRIPNILKILHSEKYKERNIRSFRTKVFSIDKIVIFVFSELPLPLSILFLIILKEGSHTSENSQGTIPRVPFLGNYISTALIQVIDSLF